MAENDPSVQKLVNGTFLITEQRELKIISTSRKMFLLCHHLTWLWGCAVGLQTLVIWSTVLYKELFHFLAERTWWLFQGSFSFLFFFWHCEITKILWKHPACEFSHCYSKSHKSLLKHSKFLKAMCGPYQEGFGVQDPWEGSLSV